MPTVVQDVSGDSALQTAIAALKAKIEGAEESSDIAQAVSQINTELNNQLSPEPYDLEIYPSLIEGEYVKSTDGEMYSNNNYKRTDFFETKGAKTITLTRVSNAPMNELNAICFYDNNKIYINGIIALPANIETCTHSIPTNAIYAIISGVGDVIRYVDILLSGIESSISRKADIVSQFPDRSYVKQRVLLENIIGVTKFPGNLVVYDECIDNEYVNTGDGSTSKNQPNYFRTGYIPVVSGTTYRANHGRNLAWYDSEYNYLSGLGTISIHTTGITAPENAAFIRFTINKTSDGISSPIELYFTDIDTYDASVKIDGLVASNVKPWCYGKKINWIGDSIVDGPDFDEQVCSAVGLVKESEYGINGSTLALHGDGTNARSALCERYTSMSDDADIIAVSCGTNDWMYAWSPIGTIESTENTTLYGALKTLCQGLIDKYPRKLIFFTTPIKRAQAFANGDGGEYTADGVNTTPFSKNKYGKTLGDYADIIKEVCGYYSIPVLDMYRESLLNPHIESQQNMFDNVLTHPNAIGQKIMARRIAGWISQLGYVIDELNN